MRSLNELNSSLSSRRRYEVWFLRLGLADGAGAWWFRYLLFNPGKHGCGEAPLSMPVQVWATWFPLGGKPQSFIQGFSLMDVELSSRGRSPFHLKVGNNSIDEDTCSGHLNVRGHEVIWNLRYRSNFKFTMSSKGWIGFSRTPHSDAIFRGNIRLDGQSFQGEPLGYGLQGHNCGYRHRTFWMWTHAYFGQTTPASTFEALVYDLPMGLEFRKAVLWHAGRRHEFRKFIGMVKERDKLRWSFRCLTTGGGRLNALLDGSGGAMHQLLYQKTDCSGDFQVFNNSLANAMLRIEQSSGIVEELKSFGGCVVEMGGSR